MLIYLVLFFSVAQFLSKCQDPDGGFSGKFTKQVVKLQVKQDDDNKLGIYNTN